MPKFNFEQIICHREKFKVESHLFLDLMLVQVMQVYPGWTKSLELRMCQDFFGAEEISVALWSSQRLEPHTTSVELRADGLCQIEAKGADIKICGNLFSKRNEGGKRTVEPDDDSCVLL